MGSKSQQNKISASDAAATAAEEPQAANDAPVSISTSDNVLSASDVAATVGGVVVIEHVQDAGEANDEHGGA
jgi:hypothetical protein